MIAIIVRAFPFCGWGERFTKQSKFFVKIKKKKQVNVSDRDETELTSSQRFDLQS